jgi:hypothetical protein
MMNETKRIPIFSGYINIQSNNSEIFNLPYMGIGCNMKNVTVTDFEILSPYVSNSSDTSSTPNSTGANETFIITTDLPNFNWRLVKSSPLVRLDILGSGYQTKIAGVNILGSVPGFPIYWVSRNDLTNPKDHYYASWKGTLNTGVQVPAGRYMFLYRALKLFGDQNNETDYESWTSPMFSIEYESSLKNLSNYSVNISFFLIFVSFLFISVTS